MGWLNDWREDMKKTFVFKAAKSVGRTGGKVVQHGLVPVASLFGGPLAAVIALPFSVAASQIGPNKNRTEAAKRAAITGGAITVGTALASLATAGNFEQSLLKSFSNVFGTPPDKKPEGSSGLDQALWKPEMNPAKGTPAGGLLDTLAKQALGSGSTTDLQKGYAEQMKLAEQYRAAGNAQAAAEAAALAEGYRQAIIAAGGTPEGPGGIPGWVPVVIVGAIVLMLASRGKAA